jgi:hypothetical protein
MNVRALVTAGVTLGLLAAAVPALAHHSYAEFDTDKKLTLEGTVKQFEWTNPHSWLLIMVPNAKGEQEQWAVELSSVSLLASRGWKPKTVLPGDKVSVTFHPMRNGSHAGSYMAIKLPNGKTMGDADRLGTAAE